MKWLQLLNATRIRKLKEDPVATIGKNRWTDDVGRSQYDRDYDRLIFSTPYKRLQDKAQVFPLESHDAVRTRLTHSMEVSCVARGLAHAAVLGVKDSTIDHEDAIAIETIAAACALAHDMGNPPFGHAGEQAIVEWFETKRSASAGRFFDAFAGYKKIKKGDKTQLARDFLKFDGNAHTQRLLSRLQVLSDSYGMNLTVATIAASCKYTVGSDETTKTNGTAACKKKHGYFASESDFMKQVFAATGTHGARHPIAHIVEAADDIVNRAADLEDGVRKRRLDPEFLKQTFEKFTRKDSGFESWVTQVETELKSSGAKKWALAEGWASAFRTWAIGKMTSAAKDVFVSEYKPIMKGTFDKDLISESAANPLYTQCKEVVEDGIFLDRAVIKKELMGKRIVHDLMDFYWEAISVAESDPTHKHFKKKIYELVSPNYRHVFHENMKLSTTGPNTKKGQIPAEYYRMQLLTDQISGMTDSFAVQLHRDLFNA